MIIKIKFSSFIYAFLLSHQFPIVNNLRKLKEQYQNLDKIILTEKFISFLAQPFIEIVKLFLFRSSIAI